MFYETEKNNHGLPFNPFKSCIIPRPIGWITTIDSQGQDNLAPYSYFNILCDVPPMVMFSTTTNHHDGGIKDTLKNVEETKEFVVNMATWSLREEVNISATDFDRGISEIQHANLLTLKSSMIKPRRIQGSPIHLECVYYQTIALPVIDNKHTNKVIIGKVVAIHIDDSIIVNGKIDVTKFQPIARLGYDEYCVVDKIFKIKREYIQPGSVRV